MAQFSVGDRVTVRMEATKVPSGWRGRLGKVNSVADPIQPIEVHDPNPADTVVKRDEQTYWVLLEGLSRQVAIPESELDLL